MTWGANLPQDCSKCGWQRQCKVNNVARGQIAPLLNSIDAIIDDKGNWKASLGGTATFDCCGFKPIKDVEYQMYVLLGIDAFDKKKNNIFRFHPLYNDCSGAFVSIIKKPDSWMFDKSEPIKLIKAKVKYNFSDCGQLVSAENPITIVEVIEEVISYKVPVV